MNNDSANDKKQRAQEKEKQRTETNRRTVRNTSTAKWPGGAQTPPAVTPEVSPMQTKRNPQGIRTRHARTCASLTSERRCNCQPSYEASVYSVRDGRKLRKTFPTMAAAKGWRRDAMTAVARGKLRAPSGRTVEDEARAWIGRAERGEVRTRGGNPYKPAVLRLYRRDLDHLPARLPRPLEKHRFTDVGDTMMGSNGVRTCASLKPRPTE